MKYWKEFKHQPYNNGHVEGISVTDQENKKYGYFKSIPEAEKKILELELEQYKEIEMICRRFYFGHNQKDVYKDYKSHIKIKHERDISDKEKVCIYKAMWKIESDNHTMTRNNMAGWKEHAKYWQKEAVRMAKKLQEDQ